MSDRGSSSASTIPSSSTDEGHTVTTVVTYRCKLCPNSSFTRSELADHRKIHVDDGKWPRPQPKAPKRRKPVPPRPKPLSANSSLFQPNTVAEEQDHGGQTEENDAFLSPPPPKARKVTVSKKTTATGRARPPKGTILVQKGTTKIVTTKNYDEAAMSDISSSSVHSG